ncbi:uncharacterized protein LOC142179930 [Nicotiana tabacum]|uniref:Uncharacterized protein LOC142179930 n=1 Tax=Nicotiana tabacum TaxID=4097 RepID=A0AC58UBQ6_TOBAC
MLLRGHLKELISDNERNKLARGREHQGPPKPSSPARTIHIIIGGSGDASINGIIFISTHKLKRSITYRRCDGLEESIIFNESNADGLIPHNDTLIITLHILDTDVNHIMVDDGSGACFIIHPRVLTQMRLEDKIVSLYITLTSFNNAFERTSREITLLIFVGGVMLETTFYIMDQATTYNAIVGQPWIHPMRDIPFILYQVVKFLTLWGIFSIHGEQRTSRECYRIALDNTITQQKKTMKKRHNNQQDRGRRKKRLWTSLWIPKWSRLRTLP